MFGVGESLSCANSVEIGSTVDVLVTGLEYTIVVEPPGHALQAFVTVSVVIVTGCPPSAGRCELLGAIVWGLCGMTVLLIAGCVSTNTVLPSGHVSQALVTVWVEQTVVNSVFAFDEAMVRKVSVGTTLGMVVA